MSTLSVTSLSNTLVVGGILKTVTQFIVVNSIGELVGRKAHATQEEAEAELQERAGYAEGLEFSKANLIDGKNAVAKANVVAEYLAWVAGGKQVKVAGDPPAAEPTESNGESF